MCKIKLPLMLTFVAVPFFACLLFFALLPVHPAQAAPIAAIDDDIAIITVTHLSLQANDIISDPTRGVIYASIPSAAGALGNRIAPIEFPNGNVGTPLFVGSEPNRMAMSSDGQYLYVGIDGASSIRRVNLISHTAELQIPLGGGFCGPIVAADMVVLQDDPHALAVVRDNTGCTGVEGVAIYDDKIARPISTTDWYLNNVIEPSASPSFLYGYENESSGFEFTVLEVSETGVVNTATQSGLLSGYSTDILFHDGLIYGTNGQVIDPVSLTSQGTYNASGPLVVDSHNGVVYIANNYDPFGLDGVSLKLFNQTEFTPIKSLPFATLDGNPKRLLMAGPQQFVMLTDTGNLYQINLGKPTYLPPAFDTTPELSAIEEQEYRYEYHVSDVNYGEQLVVSSPVLPSWLTLDTFGNTLYGYPSLSNLGENLVELLVTDSQGLTTTQRFSITVTPNPAYIAPQFISTPPLSATVEMTYTYVISASDDNEGDSLTIGETMLPQWLELTDQGNGSAIISGVPMTTDVGQHTLLLQVTDSHGLSDTQSFSITVTPKLASIAPQFTSTPPLSATVATTYTYVISTSDDNVGDSLTISATVLPQWLELTDQSGGSAIVSGVPVTTDVGQHAVLLQVTDSHGLSDTQSFSITVVNSITGTFGTVQGLLFDDVNGNGQQDNDEAGIAGALLTLTSEEGSIAAAAMQQAVITTTTSITGTYQFTDVPAGTYTLSFDLPGDQQNPASITIQVTAGATTVIPPVATPNSEQTSIFLPNVMTNANDVTNAAIASPTRK